MPLDMPVPWLMPVSVLGLAMPVSVFWGAMLSADIAPEDMAPEDMALGAMELPLLMADCAKAVVAHRLRAQAAARKIRDICNNSCCGWRGGSPWRWYGTELPIAANAVWA